MIGLLFDPYLGTCENMWYKYAKHGLCMCGAMWVRHLSALFYVVGRVDPRHARGTRYTWGLNNLVLLFVGVILGHFDFTGFILCLQKSMTY